MRTILASIVRFNLVLTLLASYLVPHVFAQAKENEWRVVGRRKKLSRSHSQNNLKQKVDLAVVLKELNHISDSLLLREKERCFSPNPSRRSLERSDIDTTSKSIIHKRKYYTEDDYLKMKLRRGENPFFNFSKIAEIKHIRRKGSYYQPLTIGKDLSIINHGFYKILYLDNERIPLMTVHEVDKMGNFGVKGKRVYFEPDLLVQNPVTKEEFHEWEKKLGNVQGKKLIYNKGHMVDAGSFYYPHEKIATFLYSNVVPQLERVNSGEWAELEHKIYEKALYSKKNITVVTGVILDKGNPGKVPRPTALYKIIFDRENPMDHIVAIAGNDVNDVPNQKLRYTNLKEIEERTGFRFFPQVDHQELRDYWFSKINHEFEVESK